MKSMTAFLDDSDAKLGLFESPTGTVSKLKSILGYLPLFKELYSGFDANLILSK